MHVAVAGDLPDRSAAHVPRVDGVKAFRQRAAGGVVGPEHVEPSAPARVTSR